VSVRSVIVVSKVEVGVGIKSSLGRLDEEMSLSELKLG
jgi:hypothetical protein